MINTNTYIIDYISIKYDRKNNYSDNKGFKESNKGIKDNSIRDLRGDPMEINQEVQGKRIKCDFCNKEFSNQHDLKTHEGMIHKQKYQDKEWLENQYITLKKSTIEIAIICNRASVTILKWLKKFNIPLRTNKESSQNFYNKGNDPWNKGTKGVMKAWNKGIPHSEESKRKMSESHKGKKIGKENSNWRGDNLKFKDGDGYFRVRGKSRYNRKTKYPREHLIVIEKYLGRPLWDWEIIHHINLIKDDNRIENLYLCENRKIHRKLHYQLEQTAIELYKSQKFGKIKFDKEKGKYYIEYKEE